MNRKKARELMMTILFQMDVLDDFNIDAMDHYFNNAKLGNQKDYCEKVYSLACNKTDDIDKCIKDNSRKWNINRIPKTDLAILRLATIEINYLDDIPDSVSINEAIEMAKIYSDEKAPAYINGILGAISREREV